MFRLVSRILAVILFLLLSVTGIVLGISNGNPVVLSFASFHSPAVPMFVWLFAVFATGLVIGALLSVFYTMRSGMRIRKQKKEISSLKSQLDVAQ